MPEETPLEEVQESLGMEGDRSPLANLEVKIESLLEKYQALKRERDELAALLEVERERAKRAEKRLEALSLDREKVKTRIDQLLLRLKGIDV